MAVNLNPAAIDWFVHKAIKAARTNDQRTPAQIALDQCVADIYAEGETELAAAILLVSVCRIRGDIHGCLEMLSGRVMGDS
jgi:hypothetical protein